MSLRFAQRFFPLCLFLPLLLMSCGEDDPGVSFDPATISGSLEVPQSTKIKAEFPAASQDPSAPSLEAETDTVYVIYATYKNVFVTLKSGDAKGFYLQVTGSGEYFNIASTKALVNHPGGNAFGFSIVLQDGIKPGSFKIAYSAYDAENRVSNIVERTVVISAPAGENSEFLSGKVWSAEMEINGTGETRDTVVIGESEKFEYQTVIDCYGEPDKPVQVVNEFRVDHKRFTFAANGSLTIEVATYQKNFDHLESTNSCSLKYTVNESVGNYEGTWSYYAESKRLILLYNQFVIDEKGTKTVYNDEVAEYDVTRDADRTILVSADKDVPVTSILY